jgi:hypothetical protein
MSVTPMNDLGRFLADSPIAERVSLQTYLVLDRMRLSAGDIEGIRRAGSYEPSVPSICELEAGGQVIASGKIVKRRGKYFLKVIETGGAG